jgi:hypothetical protein
MGSNGSVRIKVAASAGSGVPSAQLEASAARADVSPGAVALQQEDRADRDRLRRELWCGLPGKSAGEDR